VSGLFVALGNCLETASALIFYRVTVRAISAIDRYDIPKHSDASLGETKSQKSLS
jgi:hypothetical protein